MNLVRADISGSRVVVQQRADWEKYIDARSDIRYPGLSFIEVVRHGHVRARHTVLDKNAPGLICKLMRGSA